LLKNRPKLLKTFSVYLISGLDLEEERKFKELDLN